MNKTIFMLIAISIMAFSASTYAAVNTVDPIQKEFQSGDYKIETEVFEKGLYAVTLIVNGHIYAKN